MNILPDGLEHVTYVAMYNILYRLSPPALSLSYHEIYVGILVFLSFT